MEFAQVVLKTIIDGVAGLGALLLAALIGLLVVRALPHVLRAGYKFGTVAGHAIGEVIAMALRCLTAIAGVLVRVAIVAGAILAGVHVGPQMWQSYGADLPALLPALMTIALPFGAVFSFDPPVGRTFGALVAWSVAVITIGAAAEALSEVGRSVLLVGVLTTITAYTQLTGESHDSRQEQ